jgi:hypothetical protein
LCLAQPAHESMQRMWSNPPYLYLTV